MRINAASPHTSHYVGTVPSFIRYINCCEGEAQRRPGIILFDCTAFNKKRLSLNSWKKVHQWAEDFQQLIFFLLFPAVPYSKDREIFNEKMLQRYLTPQQIKRLKIFSRTIESGLNQDDVKILLVSSNGWEYFLISSNSILCWCLKLLRIIHSIHLFNLLAILIRIFNWLRSEHIWRWNYVFGGRKQYLARNGR